MGTMKHEIIVETLNAATVLLAITNFKTLQHEASIDDVMIASNFVHWTAKGPVFSCTEASHNYFVGLKSRSVKHSVFPDYQI